MQEHFLSESANLILSIEQGVLEWKASIPPSSPSNTWCVMISDQCEATVAAASPANSAPLALFPNSFSLEWNVNLEPSGEQNGLPNFKNKPQI